MPIAGERQSKRIGASYEMDPMYAYAKAFTENASAILEESGLDIYDEPRRVYRRQHTNEQMRKFFVENSYDANNTLMTPAEVDDHIKSMNEQFENDIEAMNEHAVLPEYNPIVGMSLPIHKQILMNMVFDKGGIQKFTAVSPKFTISMERRILVTPSGEEIDMFTQQNEMTAAINNTAPFKEIELTLPEAENTDVLGQLGGTALDNLVLSTAIRAIMIPDCVIEEGDILPDADGFVRPTGKIATASDAGTMDCWFATNIEFKPNYGSQNHYDRVVVQPIAITVKKTNAESGAVEAVRVTDTISATMNKNVFNISAIKGEVTKVKLRTRLDTSNGMLDTCSVRWKTDTDLVEIDTSIPINTTISPEEVKDLAALYNVNQLTKLMSMYKTALANYKDDSIKNELDMSYETLDSRSKGYATFDFAPREGYALDHVEWRHKTFFDFIDSEVTKMLQVLNDPNMTVSIFGDPELVRKITPKEYSYQAPSSIGPVELDYTQTVVNATDKRVYQLFGSDKMRGTNDFIMLLKPRNSDRIVYRIYDYQMYVSNEIRNAKNPALPALSAFERWKFVAYQPVQSRIRILNSSGLRA